MTDVDTVTLAVTGTRRGGLWRHVRDLGDGLSLAGVRVGVDLPEQATDLVAEARQRGWAVNARPSRGQVYHLHLGDTFDPAALLLLTRARARGCRVVLTEHLPRTDASDLRVATRDPRRGATQAKTALKRGHVALAHTVVAVSEGSAKFLAERYRVPRSKLATVVNGLPVSEPEHGTRNPEGADGVPVFGAVGTVIAQKGFDLLVGAAERAQLPWRVEVWGDGHHLVELRERASRTTLADGLPRVLFHGWSDEVEQHLGRMDAFVIPSRWEACPYSVLEAMRAGLPVVGTRVDGVTEQVVPEETGLLCDPTATSIAGAVDQFCLRRADWSSMGAAGRDRVRRLYDVEQMVRSTIDVYRSGARAELATR